jgi:hypothetical protein
MKFARIGTNEKSNWAAVVDNQEDYDIFMLERASDFTTGYLEAKHSIEIRGNVSHCSMQALVVSMAVERGENRQSFIDDVFSYCSVLFKPYIDMFNKHEGFYAWQNTNKWEKQYKYAGFTPISDEWLTKMKIEVLEVIEKEDTKFPVPVLKHNFTEKDIDIKCWPGGVHWYAKVDKYDVVVDDRIKWNSYERAQSEAKYFLYNILDGYLEKSK